MDLLASCLLKIVISGWCHSSFQVSPVTNISSSVNLAIEPQVDADSQNRRFGCEIQESNSCK